MVGEFHGDAPGIAGTAASDTPGKVIRFAAGIDEGASGELIARRLAARTMVQGAREPFAVLDDLFAEISRIRVKSTDLCGDRFGHMRRVAMPDMRHVVVAVEVTPPRGIGKPDAVAFDQMQRRIVEKRHAGTERPIAPTQ